MGQFGLPDWAEVKAAFEWPVLLAGNGASLVVSHRFGYQSIFENANLTNHDRELFTKLETTNFEEVLYGLDFARLVCEQLGYDSAAVTGRSSDIRGVLVETVNNHHVNWDLVEGECLSAIKTALENYKVIFTTNYDLLFYWAINYLGANARFTDHFWHAPDNSFDAEHSPVWDNRIAIYWLHGGLHLYRSSFDRTSKRVYNGATLLAQFADDGLLPLYVAEGAANEKRRAIRQSDYLTYCLETFQQDDRNLVIFGHALGDSDQHLVDAIKTHGGCEVAYGIKSYSQADVDLVRATVARRLDNTAVKFFDSTTHPLGDPVLTVE